MLVGCRHHARAFCRISIAELRRVSPSAFSILMVFSILLADGLFPVFASKYRSQTSLHLNGNLARSSGGGGSGDGSGGEGVLSSRSSSSSAGTSSNTVRYRTKVKSKTLVPKLGDTIMNGGVEDSRNVKPLRSHIHLQFSNKDSDAKRDENDRRKERGITNDKNSQIRSIEKELDDFDQYSSQRDKTIAAFGGSPSSPSSSAGSSLKSFSALSPSSLASFKILNSSNSIDEGVGDASLISSGIYHSNLDINTCPSIYRLIESAPNDACAALANKRQCLALTTNMASMVCGQCPTTDIFTIMKNSRLRFCSSYHVTPASCAHNPHTGSACPPIEPRSACLDYLQEIITADDIVEKRYDGFLELIGRYDCNSSYSVKWQCRHCKQAYKDWLCSQTIKFFRSGSDQIVPPCIEFCSYVEEMCPFFRPRLDSYAGDHSFICKDPHMNFPTPISEDNCYGLCELWPKDTMSEFYCSHANLKGANCPLLQSCDKVSQRQTYHLSNYSNTNSTSGTTTVYTKSRTPTVSLLALCILFGVMTSSLRLPLTLTNDRQYIPKGPT